MYVSEGRISKWNRKARISWRFTAYAGANFLIDLCAAQWYLGKDLNYTCRKPPETPFKRKIEQDDWWRWPSRPRESI